MITNSITYITGLRNKAYGMAGAEPMKVKIITRYSCGGYAPTIWESLAYSNGKLIHYITGGYTNDTSIEDMVKTLNFKICTQHTEYLSHIRW
ncbi:hypothetical protein VPHD472_0092 [Vibrio phage D472]